MSFNKSVTTIMSFINNTDFICFYITINKE